MGNRIFFTALLVNLVGLFCVYNPWFNDWQDHGLIFFILEAVFLLGIGLPVFIFHLRKGMRPRQALSASLETLLSFLSGWV